MNKFRVRTFLQKGCLIQSHAPTTISTSNRAVARYVIQNRSYFSSPYPSLEKPRVLGNSLLLPKRIQQQSRGFCAVPDGNIPIVSMEEVKTVLGGKSGVVIDVREPAEVSETGPLSYQGNSAKNIPLGKVPEALTFSEDDFLDEFGFEKPNENDTLIFSCKSGVRSDAACRVALAEGFVNVKNYKGSALEWFS
mmetsp:Transcript_17350/g.22702  ORF Transcript_17350/g.22702 Transcript_17350/m.22702 type:complete len:193 (-) Transcript_17350:191-769(-)